MRFRPLEVHDFEGVIEIVEEISKQKDTYGFNWDRQKLQSEFATSQCFVLEKANVLIAFLAVKELTDADEITCIVVRISERGLRHGQKIIQNFLSSRAGSGNGASSRNREVWLEVHEMNKPAIKLYQDLGFITVGNRSNYYSDGGKAILLSLR